MTLSVCPACQKRAAKNYSLYSATTRPAPPTTHPFPPATHRRQACPALRTTFESSNSKKHHFSPLTTLCHYENEQPSSSIGILATLVRVAFVSILAAASLFGQTASLTRYAPATSPECPSLRRNKSIFNSCLWPVNLLLSVFYPFQLFKPCIVPVLFPAAQ
jgi:hypothetical protein